MEPSASKEKYLSNLNGQEDGCTGGGGGLKQLLPSAMLSNLGWRSLGYRRYDARQAMFFKIYHGLAAVPMSSYFEHPGRFTRNMHHYRLRQVHVSFDFYRNSFFPMRLILWNGLLSSIVVLEGLDSFKRVVSQINYP